MNAEIISPVEEYIRLTPYFAVMQGKDEDERYLLSSIFLSLSDGAQEILTNEKTATLINQLITDGFLPETHAVAVAKLIGMIAFEEASITQAQEILEQLGLPGDHAQHVTQEISTFLQPLITERAQEELPENMEDRELPPMTMKVPQNLTGPDSSKTPARNIIDLRKQRPTS